MSEFAHPALADDEVQKSLLCNTGTLFTEEEWAASREPLPGIEHPDGPALYNAWTAPTVSEFVVASQQVRAALEELGYPLTEVDRFVDNLMQAEGAIVGYSGFGTAGYPYHVESDVIDGVFAACAQAEMPIDTIIDGGTGFGVPGLSSVQARINGYKTVGFVPERGLRGMTEHNTMVIARGSAFGSEAKALGASPDALVVIGGGPNALSELKAALGCGSIAVLAAFQDYRDDSAVYAHLHDKEVKKASDQIEVCDSFAKLYEIFESLDLATLQANRALRAEKLREELS